MSLMGYTEEDVYKMMTAVKQAKEIIYTVDVSANLQTTYDFLEGLIIEGRV